VLGNSEIRRSRLNLSCQHMLVLLLPSRALCTFSARRANDVISGPECLSIPFCMSNGKIGGVAQHHDRQGGGRPAGYHQELR